MFRLMLEALVGAGSSAEAALSAYDANAGESVLPMPVDTDELPYVSSSEAALSIA